MTRARARSIRSPKVVCCLLLSGRVPSTPSGRVFMSFWAILVILCYFGSFWSFLAILCHFHVILGHSGAFCVIFRSYSAISCHFQIIWVILGDPGSFHVILGHFGAFSCNLGQFRVIFNCFAVKARKVIIPIFSVYVRLFTSSITFTKLFPFFPEQF